MDMEVIWNFWLAKEGTPCPQGTLNCLNKSVLERISYTIGFTVGNLGGFKTVGVCPRIHAVKK